MTPELAEPLRTTSPPVQVGSEGQEELTEPPNKQLNPEVQLCSHVERSLSYSRLRGQEEAVRFHFKDWTSPSIL